MLFNFSGGSDVFLTGDETNMGTPTEDMIHLKSLLSIKAKNKYIMAIGVNIDTAHRIIQDELDNRLIDIDKSGALIYQEYLNLSNNDVKFYYNTVKKSCPINTIVHSLIISALDGHRGFYTPDHLKKNKRINCLSF